MGNYILFDKNSFSSSSLVDALVVENTGLSIDYSSINVQYGVTSDTSSISFYTSTPNDGIDITDGILLSSGTASPNSINTSTGYSTVVTSPDYTALTDSDLELTAKSAFSGSGNIYDATVLEFNFNVTDLNVHGIKFDLVFGSEEFPEYSDSSYVDIAGVYLNDKNVALFNADEEQPLSIISKNINVGNFNNNTDGHIPIEYDGISNKLTIYAPVEPGVNKLKIAIADTGDHILDSGLYVSNLQGTELVGDGLTAVTYGSDSSDNIIGTDNSETIEAKNGNDIINPGAGNDIVLAGAGDDTIYGGNGDNQIDGGDGNDTVVYKTKFNDTYLKVMDNDTIHIGENSDNILNVENIKFDDLSFEAKKLFIEDDVAKVYIAYFGRSADADGLEYWVEQIDNQVSNGTSYSKALSDVVSAFADSNEAESIYSGINDGDMDKNDLTKFIKDIYINLFNRDADSDGLNYWVNDALNLQEDGINIGTIVKTIIDGAKNTPEALDRTYMQNKAQVSWDYAKQYQLHNKEWNDSLINEAKIVLAGIDSSTESVNKAYDNILELF